MWHCNNLGKNFELNPEETDIQEVSQKPSHPSGVTLRRDIPAPPQSRPIYSPLLSFFIRPNHSTEIAKCLDDLADEIKKEILSPNDQHNVVFKQL